MNFINWLVTSSADPTKFSLFVRGIAGTAAGVLLHAAVLACGLGVYCIGIDAGWVNAVVDAIAKLAYAVALTIGPLVALLGLIRKIRLGQWSAASL